MSALIAVTKVGWAWLAAMGEGSREGVCDELGEDATRWRFVVPGFTPGSI